MTFFQLVLESCFRFLKDGTLDRLQRCWQLVPSSAGTNHEGSTALQLSVWALEKSRTSRRRAWRIPGCRLQIHPGNKEKIRLLKPKKVMEVDGSDDVQDISIFGVFFFKGEAAVKIFRGCLTVGLTDKNHLGKFQHHNLTKIAIFFGLIFSRGLYHGGFFIWFTIILGGGIKYFHSEE